LKHLLIDSVQVAFLDAQEAKNEFAWPFDTLKHRFVDFTKIVISDVQKADQFSGPFAYLKYHFRNFVQIAFFNAQNLENAF
jgi:hypothetical protein